MPEILLTTLNARWSHAAFGLRYLLANLGALGPRAEILELDISQRPLEMLEAILARQPRIVGLGVHIWNIGPATQLAADLKRLRPDVTLVLGGPEISHETEQQEISRHADYVITGEGDLAFAELCGQLLSGQRPQKKIIAADLPGFSGPGSMELPYHLYDQRDLAHRVIYVEASRGCPFGCEFCLSSLDVPLRQVPLERFLPAMQDLLDGGATHLKFVDRTFNLDLSHAAGILRFFLPRLRPGMLLHFEMIPDRLPEELRSIIAEFPAASLQLELGIQTFNPEVAQLIGRRQDNEQAERNLRFLRQQTGAHLHADLIAGLPGEDLASFARGFDRLVGLGPHEIQVGMLKRLRGAPIARHDGPWRMVYSAHPPYEVLSTKLVDFAMMQRVRRLARYWDLLVNSGNFVEAAPMLWTGASPFESFLAFSDWLYHQCGQRTAGIALPRLTEWLWTYLTEMLGRDRNVVGPAQCRDHGRCGRPTRELPRFLRPWASATVPMAPTTATLPRQARHWR